MNAGGPGTLGLADRTTRELEALAARLGPSRAASLVEEIRRSGEAEQVSLALLRIQEALVQAPGAEALATRLVLASESMQRLLQRRPGLLRWVHRSARTGEPLAPGALEAELRSFLDRADADTPEELHRRLRRFKSRQALRLAARDVWLAPLSMETLGREQSALAEALLRATLPRLEAAAPRAATGHPRPRASWCSGSASSAARTSTGAPTSTWCSSTAATATTGGGTGGALPTVTFYTRLAEALARAMSSVTEDGFCYRVDLDLRPQGRAGAAVASLPAMLQYYEQHGRTWERAAWVKARPRRRR